MANAWDISDDLLLQYLDSWVGVHNADTDWEIHLYKNDYTPVPGAALGDFTEADFNGYAAQPVAIADFGSAAIVGSHVAQTVSSTVAVFTASSSGFSSQLIYGYYYTDGSGNYRGAERFEVTRTVMPYDSLDVTPTLQIQTLPA